MRAYQDQHKQLSLADVIADSSKQKFLFICLSVGLSFTNSRMPTFQLDRKRQPARDFLCVETRLLFLNVPPQNPCLNIFIFISFCKSRLFLSVVKTEYLSLPFLACQVHTISCNHCYKKPIYKNYSWGRQTLYFINLTGNWEGFLICCISHYSKPLQCIRQLPKGEEEAIFVINYQTMKIQQMPGDRLACKKQSNRKEDRKRTCSQHSMALVDQLASYSLCQPCNFSHTYCFRTVQEHMQLPPDSISLLITRRKVAHTFIRKINA